VYDHTSFFAYPLTGIESYQHYLAVNRRRPSLLMKEGRVRVNFTVDSDGTTKDFVIAESLCTECDAEAIRLIKEGPPWRPALNRGYEKVSSKTSVDVNF
jgi:TonB family protein